MSLYYTDNTALPATSISCKFGPHMYASSMRSCVFTLSICTTQSKLKTRDLSIPSLRETVQSKTNLYIRPKTHPNQTFAPNISKCPVPNLNPSPNSTNAPHSPTPAKSLQQTHPPLLHAPIRPGPPIRLLLLSPALLANGPIQPPPVQIARKPRGVIPTPSLEVELAVVVVG